MNAPLRRIVFETAAEPPLARPDHLGAARKSAREQAAGAAVTVVAHVAAIAALVLGFHTTRPLVMPRTITVSVEQKKIERKPLEIVLPKFTPPPQITAPEPMFSIAPNPDAIAAAPQRAEPAPPTPPSAGPRDTGESRTSYLGSLLAHLNRYKQYPAEARAARIQGVVMLRFCINRQGKLLSAQIVKSSGKPALDRAAMAMIEQAQPLPEMPAAMVEETLDAVVPVHFSLRG